MRSLNAQHTSFPLTRLSHTKPLPLHPLDPPTPPHPPLIPSGNRRVRAGHIHLLPGTFRPLLAPRPPPRPPIGGPSGLAAVDLLLQCPHGARPHAIDRLQRPEFRPVLGPRSRVVAGVPALAVAPDVEQDLRWGYDCAAGAGEDPLAGEGEAHAAVSVPATRAVRAPGRFTGQRQKHSCPRALCRHKHRQ